MHQLWTTGWMHNRVRMVVASFLVKHLLLPWQEGARWFWDTLVDADLANNTLGWQWTAGCGADAAPFFRIFNPALQAERYDPAGDYVRAGRRIRRRRSSITGRPGSGRWRRSPRSGKDRRSTDDQRQRGERHSGAHAGRERVGGDLARDGRRASR